MKKDNSSSLKNRKNIPKSKNKLINKKRFIIGIIIILSICIVAICIIIYSSSKKKVNNTANNLVIKKEVVVETGTKILDISDFCAKNCKLDSKSKITYINQDKKVKNKDLKVMKIFKNNKDEEVSEDTATNEDGTIKKDFSEETIFISTGIYDVSISHEGNNYSSTLIVKDTKAPILTLKNIDIEEDDTIKIEDFVESCEDNSRETCILEFVEESKNEEEISTYKKLDRIDTSTPGAKEIIIRAKDASNNETIEKTVLTINEKLIEEVQSPTIPGYSTLNEEVENSEFVPETPSINDDSNESKTKGLSLYFPNSGYPVTQEQLYSYWGTGTAPANVIANASEEFGHGAGSDELNVCNNHYGGTKVGAMTYYTCIDFLEPIEVYDNATERMVGYCMKYMLSTGWDRDDENYTPVAEGYMVPGHVYYLWKKF